jgi:hypothetical protein
MCTVSWRELGTHTAAAAANSNPSKIIDSFNMKAEDLYDNPM